jgi:glycosyltransferase involved in cell wall biosynthesis
VLFIGRRERYKGFIHLLDAAELVWRRYREARFVFIGVPGFYGAVVNEFARYPDERIIAIERASSAEKSAALDACAMYAMPSRHETFGIGYLEAWLHEKPVIGGDIAPLREVIGHGVDGLLVPQKVKDIAAAVLTLLSDAALRERMGKAGATKLAQRWDWDSVIDRVEESYQRALTTRIPADQALA